MNLDSKLNLNHCENEPDHPFSIWKCHWSKNNKIKICRKKCQKYYQLTTTDNKLKCSDDGGWENKTIAECVENKSQEPFTQNFVFIPNRKIMICLAFRQFNFRFR